MSTAARTCPVCKRPTEAEVAPFCSKRCADVDLRQWLTGGYAIPASAEDDEGDGDTTLPAKTSEDEF